MLGALSVAISAVAYGIYIWQTTKNKRILPHPFSWLLWGFVTTVATLAQRAKGAGAGSWVTAFTALVCFIICALTFRKQRWRFSRVDKISLVFGVIALFAYELARSPTIAAVSATVADLLGYNSTIEKGWNDPYSDSATSFALNSVKFLPALGALGAYSIATCLYPATLIVVNGAVAYMLHKRRRQIKKIS